MQTKISILFALVSVGCAGGLGLASHRARETELAPAAAEGRFNSVIDRAGAFEQQHAKSRDVYWYRAWRGAAMIASGQVDSGVEVVDQVLSDLSSPAVQVAESARLRMFIYDQKAKVALARGRPADALVELDRALSLAVEVSVDDAGPCAQPLALAGRHRQIADIAASTADARRRGDALKHVTRQMEDWSLCMAKRDYPSLHVLAYLAKVVGEEGPIAEGPIVEPSSPAKVAAAKTRREPPKKEERPAKVTEAPLNPPAHDTEPPKSRGLSVVEARYAPIDASPWQPHLDDLVAILKKREGSISGGVVIRTDGAKRALQLSMRAGHTPSADSLVPLFKGTVIFFERVRDLDPSIDEVIVAVDAKNETLRVLAQKNDVVDLFVDRIDPGTFISRLSALQ